MDQNSLSAQAALSRLLVLHQDITSLADERENLLKEINNQQRKSEALMKEMDQLERELQDSRSEQARMHNHLTDLQNAHGTAQKEIENLRAHEKALIHKIQQAEIILQKNSAQLKNLSATTQGLQEKYAAKSTLLDKVENQRELLQKKINSLQQELLQLSNRYQTLSESSHQQTATVMEQSLKIQNLETELGQSVKAIGETAKEVKKSKHAASYYENFARRLLSQYNKLVSAFEVKKAALAGAYAQIQSLRQESISLREKNRDLFHTAESLKIRLQSLKEESNQAVSQKVEALREKQEVMKAKADSDRQLLQQKQITQGLIEQKNRLLSETQTEVRNLQSEILRLTQIVQNQNDRKDLEIIQLREELTKAKLGLSKAEMSDQEKAATIRSLSKTMEEVVQNMGRLEVADMRTHFQDIVHRLNFIEHGQKQPTKRSAESEIKRLTIVPFAEGEAL